MEMYAPEQAAIFGHELLLAQIYQESRFNPNAVSPVGAKGLCQVMPRTLKDWERVKGHKINPFHPNACLEFAAYYMARLYKLWWSGRPMTDRYMLALASYNAGAGNIIKAQKRCNGANRYRDIIRCLPDVTGKHSTETITYVKRILKWYVLLLLES